jgi:hypothetical protein
MQITVAAQPEVPGICRVDKNCSDSAPSPRDCNHTRRSVDDSFGRGGLEVCSGVVEGTSGGAFHRFWRSCAGMWGSLFLLGLLSLRSNVFRYSCSV